MVVRHPILLNSFVLLSKHVSLVEAGLKSLYYGSRSSSSYHKGGSSSSTHCKIWSIPSDPSTWFHHHNVLSSQRLSCHNDYHQRTSSRESSWGEHNDELNHEEDVPSWEDADGVQYAHGTTSYNPEKSENAVANGNFNPHLHTTLNDGQLYPLIAFGTGDMSLTREAILAAVFESRINHIDSAVYYGEEWLGKILREDVLPYKSRSELYITSKIEPSDPRIMKILRKFHDIIEYQDAGSTVEYTRNGSIPIPKVSNRQYQNQLNQLVFRMTKQSLKNLHIEKLDLLLAHSAPVTSKNHILPFWKALVYVQKKGLVLSIGVSNFSVGDLTKIIRVSHLPIPVVNQVQFHPFFLGMMGNRFHRDDGIVESVSHFLNFSKQNSILITAYSPLQPLKLLSVRNLKKGTKVNQPETRLEIRKEQSVTERVLMVLGRATTVRRSDKNLLSSPRNRNYFSSGNDDRNVVDTNEITEALYLWHLLQGRGVVTTSSNPKRVREIVSDEILAVMSGDHQKTIARFLKTTNNCQQWSDEFIQHHGFRTFFDKDGQRI